MKQDLDDHGFQFLGEYAGIAAKLDQVKLHDYTGSIHIEKIDNHNDYKKFIEIICVVFKLSNPVKQDLEAMYNSYASNGKFRHYMGLYAGEPVSTLTSYVDGNVVGFYNGATLEAFQKKGLCTALAQHAIRDAIYSGCEYGVSQLMAPGMAKGLSDNMGFKSYCRLLPFLKNTGNEQVIIAT